MDEIKVYIVASMIIEGIKSMHRIDVSNDSHAVCRILEESRKSLEFSKDERSPTLRICLPFITSFNGHCVHFDTAISKMDVEKLLIRWVSRSVL